LQIHLPLLLVSKNTWGADYGSNASMCPSVILIVEVDKKLSRHFRHSRIILNVKPTYKIDMSLTRKNLHDIVMAASLSLLPIDKARSHILYKCISEINIQSQSILSIIGSCLIDTNIKHIKIAKRIKKSE
jgi:hypothetical protein